MSEYGIVCLVNSGNVKRWYRFGERHRTDGPAVEKPDGQHMWYWHNNRYNFADWLEKNTYISDEDKVMLTLIYG
jgi:hypothetical protein